MPQAKAAAKKALERDETLPEAHNSLGMVLALYDFDFTQSKKEFARAIELNPKNASYYAALAQLLRKESDDKTDEAILNLQKALALDPSDALSKQELALCYEKKRNYAQAEQLLEEVVRQAPDLVSAHVALSRIYYRQHKKDEGDREKKIVARLEGQQQTEQSQTYKTSPSPVQ